MSQHSFPNRGNQPDFVLGTVLGEGNTLEVVRFHAVEEISQLFRAEIVLRRSVEHGPIDLDELLDSGATFWMATQARWRCVHGIIAEAEELDRTDKLFYYRVVLMPHWVRAKHRIRCRTFVNQSLQEILEFVLKNGSQAEPKGLFGLSKLSGEPKPCDLPPNLREFREPKGEYRFRISNKKRLEDPALYRFVVQYNESDFDFMARLLEEAGISYYFQHTVDSLLMVLSDSPGQAPLFKDDEKLILRGHEKAGSSANQEVLRGLRDTRRLKSRAVTLFDYDWKRSDRLLSASRKNEEKYTNPEALGVFTFPAKDELLDENPGDFPAQIRMERLECERWLCEGRGTLRTMEPGHRGHVHSADGLRDDAEMLIVRVESMGTQHGVEGSVLEHEFFGFGRTPQTLGAYENRFTLLPTDYPFRPAIRTPKPRISGVQSAKVSAEETDALTLVTSNGELSSYQTQLPDIHCDEYGCVRLRFPWDQRMPEPKIPSSDWVRVSHFWAGSDYGAQHIPRVGQEVLVAFMQGDPDRPVIVGRVYNPQTPIPYPPGSSAKAKTQTAWKSASTSVMERSTGYNELRFTDYKGEEEVYLQAEKDLNELVKDSHSTTVGGDQSNSVGHNQSNTVGNNRTHDIQGTESVHVHGDRTTQFDANESHSVDGFLKTRVGANESHSVVGFRKTEVGANDDLDVAGWRNTHVGTGENRTVSGPDHITVSADRRITVNGSQIMSAGANHELNSTHTYIKASGDFEVNSANASFYESGSFFVNAAGCTLKMSAGKLILDNGAGASISLVGGMVVIHSGGATALDAGGAMTLKAGGDISANAPNIKLNG